MSDSPRNRSAGQRGKTGSTSTRARLLTYVATDAPGGTGGNDGGGGGGGTTGGQRVAPHEEHIGAIYPVDDNEHWLRGDPEIMMQKMNVVVTPTVPSWSGAFPEVNEEHVWHDVDPPAFAVRERRKTRWEATTGQRSTDWGPKDWEDAAPCRPTPRGPHGCQGRHATV